jgi:hypothetical protein
LRRYVTLRGMSFPSPEQPRTGSIYVPGAQPQQFGHPPAAPSAPRRDRRPAMIALFAAIALAVAAAGVYWLGFSDITIRGSITLTAGGTGYGTAECHGTGAYSGLTGGAQIEITDGAEKTIALGQLGPGRVTDDKGCVFEFSVDAPRADVYGIKVSHREVLKVSRAQAEDSLSITVGG